MITYSQVFENITFTNLSPAEQAASIEALEQIERTPEGQAYLLALANEYETVDLFFEKTGSSSGWNNVTDNITVSFNDIYEKAFMRADGEAGHYSLQRILMHEGYHGIENQLFSGLELDEGRANQFANEYMAKSDS